MEKEVASLEAQVAKLEQETAELAKKEKGKHPEASRHGDN